MNEQQLMYLGVNFVILFYKSVRYAKRLRTAD